MLDAAVAGAVVLLAGVATPVPHADLPCVSYAEFGRVIEDVGARQTQTIELPSFPDVKRLIVVAVAGTRELFLARLDCVIVPALWVDHGPGLKDVPVINWNFAEGV